MKFDWKHMALGLAGVVTPVAVHYLMSVDWSSLGPVWTPAVLGLLTVINEYVSNMSKKA